MQHVHRVSRFARWFFGIALLALAPALGASAYDQGYGYVWANDPTAASYTPPPFYAYNEAGPAPTITRTSVGRYDVTFPGLSALSFWRGNVQVTAYGTTNHYCKVRSWSGDTVSVACFANNGTLADTRYNLLYLLPDSYQNNYAFALADQPTAALYTTNGETSFNPVGGNVTAIRAATGEYAIDFEAFEGVGADIAHFQVTAYGTGSARCRLEGWLGGSAQVRCYNASGALVDSAYSILAWRPTAGEPGLAFAWANQPTSASYTPWAENIYDASNGPITATRSSPGVYQMRWLGFPGAQIHGGNIQVSAYGTVNRCKVASWTANSAAIRCHDTAGNPSDSRYTVMFLKPQKKAWSREYAFAYADQPAASLYPPPPATSYNPLGGGMLIQRTGTGAYNVHFEGFDAFAGPGNAHVTAVDTTGRYCKVDSWTAEDVRVRCFTLAGAPANTRFTVLYLKSSTAPNAAAYSYVNDPFTASYEPPPTYTYNPSGGPVTVTRTAGQWWSRWNAFGAFGSGSSVALATAVGLDNRRCAANDWGSWDEDLVKVHCQLDQPTPHSVLYLRPEADDDGLAFASSLGDGSFPPRLVFNAGEEEVSGNNLGGGRYRINFSGMKRRGIGDGHFQVMGTDPESYSHCAIEAWYEDRVNFRCFDSAGPHASSFAVLYIKPIALP